MPTTGSITSGQIVKVTQLSEDAIRRAVRTVLDGLTFTDTETFQHNVVERGDEYIAAIERKVAPIIETTLRELTISDEFANEEVASSYGYLSGYTTPRPIGEQVQILQKYFPQLGNVDIEFAEGAINPVSEGCFAIPRWQKIANTYGEAVEKVLDALKKARKGKLVNYRENQLGPDRLRETDRKRLAMEKIAASQPGQDILVVAAQFGLRHRGRSVRRARVVMPRQIEFGLGAFEGLIMLLTHPERLQHLDDLWIDFAGDEFSPGADGRFGSCPCAGFGVGRVDFDTVSVDYTYDNYGSVSGFFPQ